MAEPMFFTDAYEGYDDLDPDALLYDARNHTRGQARAAYAMDTGEEFTAIEVTTRYARWLSRDEHWETYRDERWADDHFDAEGYQWTTGPAPEYERYLAKNGRRVPEPQWPDPPEEAPADWEAPDGMADWAYCDRDDPDAVKVYRCCEKSPTRLAIQEADRG